RSYLFLRGIKAVGSALDKFSPSVSNDVDSSKPYFASHGGTILKTSGVDGLFCSAGFGASGTKPEKNRFDLYEPDMSEGGKLAMASRKSFAFDGGILRTS